MQEAVDKIAALPGLDLVWHFIGPIQSNKTRQIAEHFDWVHSIERVKIAERLSAARARRRWRRCKCAYRSISATRIRKAASRPARCRTRATCRVAAAAALRGLMTIPPASDDVAVQRAYFAQLRRLRDELAANGLALDTLSMGMSADLEAAIAEGATIVRVGTAIFGARQVH